MNLTKEMRAELMKQLRELTKDARQVRSLLKKVDRKNDDPQWIASQDVELFLIESQIGMIEQAIIEGHI
jgi:hypothetical protein